MKSFFLKRFPTVFTTVLILFIVLFFKSQVIHWWTYSSGYRFLIIEIVLLFLLKTRGWYSMDSILFPQLFKWYIILIIANCVTCYIFRGQGIQVSLLGWESFFLIFFYPVFKSWNFSLEQWEKILMTLFSIILTCYVFLNIYPESSLFTLDKIRSLTNTELRIRVWSDAILFLGTLYCWNKYLVLKKKWYLLLFVVGSLMIFLQGYRILVASMFISCVCLYLHIFGFSKKSFRITVSLALVLVASLYVPVVQEKIEEMTNRSERDREDGEDAVRAMDLAYVYSDHFKSNIELITGSGMPFIYMELDKDYKYYVNKSLSSYSKEMSELAAYNHFFIVDLGLIGLSWVAGIPFVLLFLYLLIRIITTKVNPEHYYLCMYALLITLCGFTNALSYKHHNIIYLALVLVILDLAKKRYDNENWNSYTSIQ